MPRSDPSMQHEAPAAALVQRLIDQIEELLLEVERTSRPLELDPFRGRLFELFVMADATGFLAEGGEHDLSCDGVARALAGRWNIARSVGPGAAQLGNVPPQQLSKLRLLWAFMRMWMEWTYAWSRWHEFHDSGQRE